MNPWFLELKIHPSLACSTAALLLSCFGLATNGFAAGQAPIETSLAVTELTVTSTADSGPGSLRAALEAARQSESTTRITFGTAEGAFNTPQVIELDAPLPLIESEVEIDGHIPGLLWKAYGAAINGRGQFRIFEVAPEGRLRIFGITLENGSADIGAAILNRGHLVAEGVTFLANEATESGGAIANDGGEIYFVNSTAHGNSAPAGGGLANLSGHLRVINATLHANAAEADQGGAISSSGHLQLSNSILQGEGLQCLNSGTLDELTSSNLFEQGRGCGEPILRADPKLGKLDYFNGPTPTLPLSSLSPALNLGNNSVAVNHNGEPLKWDQRGNGDPRFARGYVDIGAFEHQSQLPRELIVDTTGDTVLRGCTPIAPGNCPLKAAVDLSLSGRTLVPIRFKQSVFTEDQTLQIDVLPENADQPLVIDGSGTGGVTIMVPASVPWRAINGARIELTASTSRNGR